MLGYHLAQVVRAQSISQVTLAFDAHNATRSASVHTVTMRILNISMKNWPRIFVYNLRTFKSFLTLAAHRPILRVGGKRLVSHFRSDAVPGEVPAARPG